VPGFDLDLDDAEVRRKLQWLVAQLLDLRPFWPKVSSLAIGWWGAQFETEGVFGGHPWPPLSPGYGAWKAATHPGRGLLVLERDLREAASRPDRLTSPTTLTLTIPWARMKGENVDLDWHQRGTDRMPARPLIFGDPLPPQARVELDIAMDEYLDDLIRRSGL
jgi:hypothetical protein